MNHYCIVLFTVPEPLILSLNGADPLIYIRAWQPNEWDSAALVNSSNFRIYK